MTTLQDQGLTEPLTEAPSDENMLPDLPPMVRTVLSREICGIEDVPHDQPLVLTLKGGFDTIMGVSDFKGTLFLEAVVGADVEETTIQLLITRKNVPFDIRYIPGLQNLGCAGPFAVFRIMMELVDQARERLEENEQAGG